MPENPLAHAKILIVDDDPDVLTLCTSVLRSAGYLRVRSTPDSRGVLALFVEYDPDILILDIMMPHLDGLQLLGMLQKSARYPLSLPIIVMTGFPSPERRYSALAGGAVDILEKPFDCNELVLRINNLLRIRLAVRDVEAQTHAVFEELLERTEELSAYQLELKEAHLEIIARLARAGEQHDDVTGQHTQRVSLTVSLLAQGLGLSPDAVDNIQRAAPLHDVGKIGVPDSILLKPGKLAINEFQIMQRHCKLGSELLSGGRSEIVQMAESIALTHHERWNGEGYPHGLRDSEIPIEGRIVAVADVFDALTHERPYKGAWKIGDALKEIRGQAGQQFDPDVVEVFMQLPHADLI